jgi:hypothetical protein
MEQRIADMERGLSQMETTTTAEQAQPHQEREQRIGPR